MIIKPDRVILMVLVKVNNILSTKSPTLTNQIPQKNQPLVQRLVSLILK